MTQLDSLFDLEGKPELNPKIGSTWSGQKIGLGLAALVVVGLPPNFCFKTFLKEVVHF